MKLIISLLLMVIIVGCGEDKKSNDATNEAPVTDNVEVEPEDSTTKYQPIVSAPVINPADSISTISKAGNLFTLRPITAQRYDQRLSPAPTTLKKEQNVKIFESDNSGEYEYTKTYEGTLRNTGFHVYNFSGYEQGGYQLLYPGTFEPLLYNHSQTSMMPIESDDGSFIFQFQEELGYAGGLVLYSFENTDLHDIAWFGSIILLELKGNRDTGVLLKVKKFGSDTPIFYELRHLELPKSSTMIDSRDGQEYPIELVNRKWWTNRNLNFKIDSSGVYTKADSSSYGRYYTWEDATKVCPEGWELPTIRDWNNLFAYWRSNYSGLIPYWNEQPDEESTLFTFEDSLFTKTRIQFAYGGVYHSNKEDLRPFFSTDEIPNFINDGFSGYYWSQSPNLGYAFISDYCGDDCHRHYVKQRKDSRKVGFCIRCVKDATYDVSSEMPNWLNTSKLK